MGLVFASSSALGANAFVTPTSRRQSGRAICFPRPSTTATTDHLPAKKPKLRPQPSLWVRQPQDEGNASATANLFLDYLSLLRPVTLVQAVGAWVVGRLLGKRPGFAQPQEWLAMACVYLVYGVGMVANDCADANLDQAAESQKERQRAIASGRVSVKQGWIFVGLLTAVSLATAFLGVSTRFGAWCAGNVALMLLYAGGLQNILLIKNVLVGWLCIAPLWGAATLNNDGSLATNALFRAKTNLLAAAGFSLGVVREILKDVQDVEPDSGTKFTLPIWIGEKAATRVGLGALGATLAVLQTPLYRRMFAVEPLYSTAWVLAAGTCWRAGVKPTIDQKQAGVKKSIYVLLAGLIGSMMLGK